MSEEKTMGDTKMVTFRLSEQMFAIEMAALVEIREWEDPTPLPSVPSFIKGVTNLRGHVVPVIGLAERLGWPPSQLHDRSCILVVNIGEKQAGFLVDEVADIVTINREDIQPAPDIETDDANVIDGLVQVSRRGRAEEGEKDEIMVSLLNLEKLSVTRHLDLAA
ncbi:chemotaxis protein CheW [Sphingorhabdus sp. M41]|uniref:chemotaxis protein CheW n=1 Tax=Sphingorhabdus sp. M41 TaxID=1806885 RepID=UPI00078C6D01|nr:chemotaxis protein CheW [Sphingorhabdus sp. M41]AMO72628.1 chemotaxis protein CheW [Sphingorhabdus sp. M41]